MSSKTDTIGIVGAGSFGLALAKVLADDGRNVLVWSKRGAVVDAVTTGKGAGVLEGTDLPSSLRATADVGELADACRFLVVAVPSESAEERLKELGAAVDGSHIAVHAIGALAAGEERVSQVIVRETPILRCGVIAGPSLSEDLIAGRGTSMVCASEFDEVTVECQRLLACPPRLRLYRSRDLVGVELASALSGAFTIAVGLADAMNVGIGMRSVLMTRAVSEMTRLGLVVGGESKTFSGLAGLGNLLVRTAVDEGRMSPSYKLGMSLPKGDRASWTGEGIRAARAGAALAQQRGVDTPLLAAIAKVFAGDLGLEGAATELLERVATEE